jgi:hypothetical protein
MLSHRTLLILLTLASYCISTGTSRLQIPVDHNSISIDTIHQHRLVSSVDCLPDSTECDRSSTCFLCCSNTILFNNKTTSCGTTICITDGIPCVTAGEGNLCHNCCNKAIDNNRQTCGGQCTKSGTVCSVDDENIDSCLNCCDDIYYMNDNNEFVCGCMEDGVSCNPDENCYACCNGAYDDNGTTCGGQCTESGTACTLDTDSYSGTCSKCCNFTRVKIDEDSYECGCLEDGTKCIPGETCYDCCNGAYDDKGYMCGGTCIPDATKCILGMDCHLCCNGANYWYQTGTMQCGYEPCYLDGETCIPGQTCDKCCTGGAYGTDDTICGGGTCLPKGTECTYSGTCNKCCPDNNMRYGPPYRIGSNPHWNSTIKSMVCGYELCWKDGIKCVPGYTCSNCCNSLYADISGTSKCGGNDDYDGTCIKSGTKCNYFSTCSSCCGSSIYNTTLGYHTCSDSNTD